MSVHLTSGLIIASPEKTQFSDGLPTIRQILFNLRAYLILAQDLAASQVMRTSQTMAETPCCLRLTFSVLPALTPSRLVITESTTSSRPTVLVPTSRPSWASQVLTCLMASVTDWWR